MTGSRRPFYDDRCLFVTLDGLTEYAGVDAAKQKRRHR
jgi:hypothetical protein